MAKIQKVDYVAIPTQARQMRSLGQSLNTEMTNAYTNIENMHNSWYGKRYNELVKQFNNLTTQINDMLTLVVTDIPYALETVANNYSQADTGSKTTTAQKTAPKKVTNLTINNDVGMKFITTTVEEIQQKVSNNFNNAKNKMSEIQTEYAKISWESEASDEFKNKFDNLKRNISSSFDSIESQFKKLMNQTKEDIQNAENANKVSSL